MKNNKLFLVTLASGFALALAAPAFSAGTGKGPCAEDAAKFCKDIKPGGGRVAACLKEHQADLSQACRDRKALKGDKRQARAGKRMKGGTCMHEYGKGFASGFKSAIKMRAGLGLKEGRGKKAAGKVCAADKAKLCGDVKPGEGRVKDCLMKNMAKLSEGCQARQEKIKERQQGKKA